MQILPRFNFKLKSAYLIIHITESKSLQSPLLNTTLKQFEPQFTAVNEKNNKSLWIIDQREPGFVQLVNGFCDKVLSADDDGKLMIRKGKGVKKQYWVLSQNNGFIRIQNAQHKGLFLAFDTIKKRPVLKRNALDLWEFRKVTKNEDLNRTCFIYDPLQQKMIDVPESSLRQQQTIYVWKPNYRFNQRWTLHKAGQVYIIKSYLSKLNLDVYEQNFSDDQKIIQYHSTGGMNQLWMLQRMENSLDEFRIYCFAQPEFQLGHNGKRLKLHKGRKFVWKIQGFIPQ